MCDRLPVGYKQMWVLQVRPRARLVITDGFWSRYQILDGKTVLGFGPSETQAWNRAAGDVYGEIDGFALRQWFRLQRQGWTPDEIADKCMNDFRAFTNEQHMCFIGRDYV